MEKELFKKKFNKASDIVDNERMIREIKRTMDDDVIYIGKSGTRNLIIVIEELAELQEQLSIHIDSPEYSKISLTEEIADVTMALEYVKIICEIDDKDIPEKINPDNDMLNVIKDFSQLQQLLSKILRGKTVSYNTLLASVTYTYCGLVGIRYKFNISTDDIAKAMNVKIDRLSETKSFYE